MARLDILQYPDPRLRRPASPVTAFDGTLARTIGDLFDTLYATPGIGLSAPQIGDQRQVLVMDLSGNAAAPQVYVNPQILSKSAWGLVEESCLSVPGIAGNVIRATQIRVRAQDRNGDSFERELKGMEAVCLQHEADHLAGMLFIDRLSLLQRLRIRVLNGVRARPSGKAA
jgi:peptide deformylase